MGRWSALCPWILGSLVSLTSVSSLLFQILSKTFGRASLDVWEVIAPREDCFEIFQGLVAVTGNTLWLQMCSYNHWEGGIIWPKQGLPKRGSLLCLLHFSWWTYSYIDVTTRNGGLENPASRGRNIPIFPPQKSFHFPKRKKLSTIWQSLLC